MKFLIKIDRNSIKENLNAGNQDYFIDNGSTSTLTFNVYDKEINDHLEKNFNTRLVRYNISISKGTECEHRFMGDKCEEIFTYLKKMGVKPEYMQVNTQYHHECIRSMTPEPKYFWDREDTELQCQYCNAKFPHSKLGDEEDYDDDGYSIGRSNICPKCNKEDCCEIEFEQFVDSLVVHKGA